MSIHFYQNLLCKHNYNTALSNMSTFSMRYLTLIFLKRMLLFDRNFLLVAGKNSIQVIL